MASPTAGRPPERNSCDQVLVPELRLLHAGRDVRHLFQRVEFTDVVATCELADVPMQMLRTDLMERTLVRPLEHGPERFHAVGVDLAANVLAHRMLDRFMLERDALIGGSLIGVDGSVRVHIPSHEALQCLSVRRRHDSSHNLVGRPVLGSDDCCLSNGSPACQFLALGVGHIAALPAHIGLVHFNRAGKQVAVTRRQSLADAVCHVPRGPLRYRDVPVQLHAGDALEIRCDEEQGEEPVLIAKVRRFHERSCLDREEPSAAPQFALAAAVGHSLVLRVGLNALTATPRTVNSVGPPMRDKPSRRRCVIGEEPEELLVGDPLAV